ncbi:restriction endonuclease subunit S [Brachyspira hyodysenteriae]|uniref:restriction endonuclease subunit S n=1 Tax=Brachyspira hyodysenteriae TaxID=159 RepID=UPI0022CD5FFC|nr:restriction endonuclease subunit S [Brachyspira hyodysenteriae]MCZ9851440.1 restriction endonuclease subunit S [Brachyspira hyodysenteriae]MCZ9859833.1 restriction endonuclease subunit S [Brachyspira hyodysenteriae]MCZ9876516.1 restriction endonuclease subunit S [Brachyspira hyodysenteriae]MCZ9895069.1 restriction endonuclease subunit S [Brachyspira hyodysenteriae]MCZ9901369.1 restriction endonuclease subunit S [Brachyspira hyodysenteriae]
MINNWEETKLGKLCDVIAGQSPQSKFYNKEKYGLPFYQGKKEFTNKYIGETEIYTSKITKIALPNDILMSVRAPVGPINYAVKKCCIGRGLAAIRVKEGVLSDFIYYFLLSKQDYIKGHEGTTFNSISRNEIEDLNIIFPPIEEQKKIVEKLDNAFQKIESLENNTKENIKNIEDLYNSYLNKIFTENTDDWEEKTLDELCYILDSKRVPITKKYRNTGIYPYYGATGIQDYIDSYIFDETLLLVGEDGAKWGRCENTAFIVTGKFWVNNHAHVLKIKKDTIYEWLKYCLNYTDLSEYITGTTVPKLNQEKLKQIKVPIPKIEEQKKIVDKLDIFNNKIESIKQNYQNKLTLLEKLKKSILKKAFNGEL